MKIFGNRLNLDEMDRMIKGKYETEVACTGLDDRLYIFLTNGEIAEEVRIFASDKTGLNLRAFHVILIDEIPKNEAGKIKYKELEKYYEV